MGASGEQKGPLLGAIIAGGRATRFGGDKAAALLDGKPLIEHVAAALRPQVDALVVCGRDWPGLRSIPDRPAPGLGPLGGLCAALHHAEDHGFGAVLTAGCDVLPIPPNLAAVLAPGPSHIDGQPLLALWPATLAGLLDHHIERSNRSLRSWAAAAGARSVASPFELSNLNTQADLERYGGG